jgi:hypothetical protein
MQTEGMKSFAIATATSLGILLATGTVAYAWVGPPPFQCNTAISDGGNSSLFKSYAFAHPLRDHQALPIASLFYHEWRGT